MNSEGDDKGVKESIETNIKAIMQFVFEAITLWLKAECKEGITTTRTSHKNA